MATGRKRMIPDDLTPDRRAKAEALAQRWHTPGSIDEELRDREALLEEYRQTGTIDSAGVGIEAPELLRFRRFVERLRDHRERQGLSLATVSERSGIDQPALNRLEDGRTPNPTVGTLAMYAQVIGAVIRWDFVGADHVGD